DESKAKKCARMPAVGSKGGPLPPTPRPRAGVQFGPPSAKAVVVEPAPEPAKAPKAKVEKPQPKCDPKLIAAARELRDRWMEEVNSGRFLPESNGKYEVSRQIAASDQRLAASLEPSAVPLLPAA